MNDVSLRSRKKAMITSTNHKGSDETRRTTTARKAANALARQDSIAAIIRTSQPRAVCFFSFSLSLSLSISFAERHKTCNRSTQHAVERIQCCFCALHEADQDRRRPLALAFVDRCLLMQTVRIGAAIAFDVASTLNGNDERLPELELRRQQQYTHIYNKTQSTTTTKQQSTTQPKATTFNNIRIIIPSSTPTTSSTITTTTTTTATAAASASTTDDKLATVNLLHAII
jgi:hypothetical protein